MNSAILTTSAEADITMGTLITEIKQAVGGVFEIAGSGFNFLIANPLAAFIVGSGFAFTALSLIRKALRVAKRS